MLALFSEIWAHVLHNSFVTNVISVCFKKSFLRRSELFSCRKSSGYCYCLKHFPSAFFRFLCCVFLFYSFSLISEEKQLTLTAGVSSAVRHYIQLKSERPLIKPYVNEVILRGQNLSLKCCQPLELLTYIERGFRSFPWVHLSPLSSLDFLWNHSQSLTDGNFAVLWSTDLVLPVWKDQKPLSMYVKSSGGWQPFKDRFCPLKITSFT